MSKYTIIVFNVVMYLFLLRFLVSYTLFIWFVTNIESFLTFKFFAPTLCANFNLDSNSSYSASLFVVSKSNCNVYVILFPYRLVSMRPTTDPSLLVSPSVYNVHVELFPTTYDLPCCCMVVMLHSLSGTSVRKSVKACHFIFVMGWYSISCSPNSMTHFINLPDFFGFSKILLKV